MASFFNFNCRYQSIAHPTRAIPIYLSVVFEFCLFLLLFYYFIDIEYPKILDLKKIRVLRPSKIKTIWKKTWVTWLNLIWSDLTRKSSLVIIGDHSRIFKTSCKKPHIAVLLFPKLFLGLPYRTEEIGLSYW